MKVLVVLVLSLVFLAASCAEKHVMTKEEIFSQIPVWWAKISDEDIDLQAKKIEPIHLRSGEVAYVVDADFYGRGRNFINSAVLVRPALHEIREVKDVIMDFQVVDLDGDGVSEIVSNSFGSGGGSIGGAYLILQFDGWDPVVLHEAGYYEFDDVIYGKGWVNEFIRPSWKFHSKGNTICMTENIWTRKDGSETQSMSAYLFQKTKFVPISYDECSRWPLDASLNKTISLRM